jgi:hypothetical protein
MHDTLQIECSAHGQPSNVLLDHLRAGLLERVPFAIYWVPVLLRAIECLTTANVLPGNLPHVPLLKGHP